MKLLIPLLALFLWLASASQQDGAYSQSDIDAVTRLSMPPTLKERQRAAIMDLWSIKEAEVDRRGV